MFLINDGSGWHHRLEFTIYYGFDWPGHGQTKGSHLDYWPHLSPSFPSLITSSSMEVKAFSLSANSEKRVSCFFFFRWWNLSQLATGSYFAMGRGGARCCGSVPVALGQAGIVIIPPPSRVYLVPAVGSFGKCLNHYPGFHRWHLHCRDPSLTHKEKEKKRKGEMTEQMPWSLPRGEHLENWPLQSFWKHDLFLHD